MLKCLYVNTFLVILLSFAPSISCSDNPTLYNQLKSNGHIEFENHHFLREGYDALYNKFDLFIDNVQNDDCFFKIVTASENEFTASEECKTRYCSAPPSYRDPKTHSKKIMNRIYFQFIKEHYQLIKEKYTSLFNQYPDMESFFKLVNKVDSMAKEYFDAILTSLEKEIPGIKKMMYGNNQELTVITKIVRYKNTANWHEKPHFDKCGLTLIWDNDDNHQSLMICNDTTNPTKGGLCLPPRQFVTNSSTSTILIGGLCMQAVGIDIKPTLHYVGPIKNEYRHSLISFLLVPNIDTSEMKTEFIEK